MRMPQSPPDRYHLMLQLGHRLPALLAMVSGPSHNGQYLHWDKLRRLDPPPDLSHEEWWLALKFQRLGLQKEIPLQATNGRRFSFLLPDPIPERLHRIDLGAGGLIGMDEQITNPATRDRYVINSLMEEAITSSQIEGAVTTRPIAREMIRSGRTPRDRSEQMILNNFRTMRFIQTQKDQALTPEFVCELQRRVMEDTLDDPSAAGRFRHARERVDIADMYGEVFHRPPPADELPVRMQEMCRFANGESPSTFIHPVIRSIILHFWLGYDHPFVDGNGRCARALFYWSMLRHGYWLCEHISISHVIRKAPGKYYRAFLYTETDDNDLTYFLLYHVELIQQALEELHEYIRRKMQEVRDLEHELRSLERLNHRQKALISHAMRHPDARYSVQSHQLSHNVVYETARNDLLELSRLGLLKSRKVGKAWQFTPVTDLKQKLREPE